MKNKQQTPIDVYDSASWMAITCLSEDSVAMGGHPVPIPDFTNGKWIKHRPVVESTFGRALTKSILEYDDLVSSGTVEKRGGGW